MIVLQNLNVKEQKTKIIIFWKKYNQKNTKIKIKWILKISKTFMKTSKILKFMCVQLRLPNLKNKKRKTIEWWFLILHKMDLFKLKKYKINQINLINIMKYPASRNFIQTWLIFKFFKKILILLFSNIKKLCHLFFVSQVFLISSFFHLKFIDYNMSKLDS